MKDYSFYDRALKLDKKNAGKYYAERAVLYFRDMEYDLAWQDFQKADELGFYAKHLQCYIVLKACQENRYENISIDFDEEISYSSLSNYIWYCLIKHNYANAFSFLGNLLSRNPNNMLYQKKMQDVFFEMKRQKYRGILKRLVNYESAYFNRIKLYTDNFKKYSSGLQKYFRTRINQDFDKLEKISINPEYICLLRSKYFENQNEIRYAIKFCQKAIDIAKKKNNKGFVYIASSILKDLYVKNYQTEKALEIAMELVETKPTPQILSKEVNCFNYIPSLFHYEFPPEFEKYKSYRQIAENIKKIRKIKFKRKKDKLIKKVKEMRKQRKVKNGKDNNR